MLPTLNAPSTPYSEPFQNRASSSPPPPPPQDLCAIRLGLVHPTDGHLTGLAAVLLRAEVQIHARPRPAHGECWGGGGGW